MKNKAIIDFGSRSIKVYQLSQQVVSNVLTHSWDPITRIPASEELDSILQVIKNSIDPNATISAIATEAARRSGSFRNSLKAACNRWNIEYKTITQQYEAELIRHAFSYQIVADEKADIINVGGGSIQIVQSDNSFTLLPFGISDLNAQFNLAARPEERAYQESINFIIESLPHNLKCFIYTGGELTYLKAVGGKVAKSGRCFENEFKRISNKILKMEIGQMEKISPFDKGWMTGAVASNAIVEAFFKKSGSEYFYPSDQNISHGLIYQLINTEQ